MAFPTAVNNQITDAVTQSNVSVVSEAPSLAMGTLYQTSAHSLGISFENAVAGQQQQNVVANATTTSCVASLLGENKAS